MPTTDELRAALAAAEAEEELAAAKETAQADADAARAKILAKMAKVTDPDELRKLADQLGSVTEAVDPELKLRVREARRVFREMREQYPAGEGEARPAAIAAGVTVNTDEVN